MNQFHQHPDTLLSIWGVIICSFILSKNNCFGYDDVFIFTLFGCNLQIFHFFKMFCVNPSFNLFSNLFKAFNLQFNAIDKLKDWYNICPIPYALDVYYYFGKCNSIYNRFLAFFLCLWILYVAMLFNNY